MDQYPRHGRLTSARTVTVCAFHQPRYVRQVVLKDVASLLARIRGADSMKIQRRT